MHGVYNFVSYIPGVIGIVMEIELQPPDLPKLSGVDGLHEAKKKLRIVEGEGVVGVEHLLAFLKGLPAAPRDNPV